MLENAVGGLKLRHLPTNGGGPAITAILGNNAQCSVQSVSATLPHIKSGKLRPLVLFGATRSKALPNVPTLKELGYNVEYYLWVGIFAPKGTPAPVTTTIRATIDKAAHSPAFMTAMTNLGQDLAYLDGPDFQKFWDVDGSAWMKPSKPSAACKVKQRGHQMDRRNFVIGTAASAATLAAGRANAQDAYPSHSITVINPFPPGGVSDTITRPLDAALEVVLKQPVVLENKPGAAGAVGAQFVAAAKPDGYTLLTHLVSISGFAAVDKLFGRTPKFTNDDFIPLARIVADPIVMIINNDLPYKSLKELVDDAKANPNKLIFSSSGLYGASHIPTALLAKAAGNLQMRHLPTNGGGPAVTAVLGGNVNFFMSPTSIALPHIKAGKVRPLAVSSAVRAKSLPDVPTFKEQGYDLEYYFWVGLFAPKGTPDPVVKTLRDGVDKAAHSKEFLKRMDNLGQELAYMDQPEFAKFWAADAKKMEDAINPSDACKDDAN